MLFSYICVYLSFEESFEEFKECSQLLVSLEGGHIDHIQASSSVVSARTSSSGICKKVPFLQMEWLIKDQDDLRSVLDPTKVR